MSIRHEEGNRNNAMPVHTPEDVRVTSSSAPVTVGEQASFKQGLKIFGYVVPWWVIVVVVLLVIYLAYDQGWLDGLTGKSNSQENVVGLPQGMLAQPQTGGLNSSGLNTPTQMRELFGRRNW